MFKTILSLRAEAKEYARGGEQSFGKIFSTLLRLYVRSKLSRKNEDGICEKIGHLQFCAFDYPSLIGMYRDIFIKRAYDVPLKSTRPFIIDCGSNIGISVLFFKLIYPESEIWAFEPNPHSYSMLKKNIEVNRLGGVRLFNSPLSDEKGLVDFYVPLDKASINGSYVKEYCESEPIQLKTILLSDLLESRQVDLIKIDVEGAEEEILNDLESNNKLELVHNLVVEYHDNIHGTGSSHKNFISRLEKAGFISRVKSIEEPQNFLIEFTK